MYNVNDSVRVLVPSIVKLTFIILLTSSTNAFSSSVDESNSLSSDDEILNAKCIRAYHFRLTAAPHHTATSVPVSAEKCHYIWHGS